MPGQTVYKLAAIVPQRQMHEYFSMGPLKLTRSGWTAAVLKGERVILQQLRALPSFCINVHLQRKGEEEEEERSAVRHGHAGFPLAFTLHVCLKKGEEKKTSAIFSCLLISKETPESSWQQMAQCAPSYFRLTADATFPVCKLHELLCAECDNRRFPLMLNF